MVCLPLIKLNTCNLRRKDIKSKIQNGVTVLILKQNLKKGYKPILVNRKEKKLKMFGEIPNGSNIKVRLEPWETDNRYGHFKGFTLIAVMLLDEVPKLFV